MPQDSAKVILIPRFFYGWYMVAIAYLSLFLTASASTTLSVLIPTMSADLGWSVSTLVGASSIGVAIGAVIGPWIGRLVDQRGPRLLMAVSIFTLGLVCAQTGAVTEPWQLYLGFGVIGGICRTGSMYIGPGALLANWFLRKRATASGFAALGPPSCSIVIPAFTTMTMAAFGWRGSWFVYGAVCMLLFAPPVALFVRHRPEALGLLPDGAAAPITMPGSGQPPSGAAPEDDWTLRETLRSRGFWLLAVSMALIGLLPNTIFVLHFSTFKAQGLPESVAAGCVAVSGLPQVVSRIFVWTPLVGRLGVRRGLFAWSGLILVGGLLWA
ncbi:MAG: MFS transporter, partial [Chloroflexota bacterium]